MSYFQQDDSPRLDGFRGALKRFAQVYGRAWGHRDHHFLSAERAGSKEEPDGAASAADSPLHGFLYDSDSAGHRAGADDRLPAGPAEGDVERQQSAGRT